MKKVIFVFSLLAVLTFSNVASAQKTIADIAASNQDFSTLVTTLKATDLISKLQSEGDFTVFAPVNSAFQKMDKTRLNELLKPEGKTLLADVIKYHIIPKKIMVSDISKALSNNNGKIELKGLNNQVLKIISKDGKIFIKDLLGNYSEIIKTDISASNGVIHVINNVIVPGIPK